MRAMHSPGRQPTLATRDPPPRPRRSALVKFAGIERLEIQQVSDWRSTDARPGALDRKARLRAMQMKAGAVCACQLGTSADRSVSCSSLDHAGQPRPARGRRCRRCAPATGRSAPGWAQTASVGHVRNDGSAYTNVPRRCKSRLRPDAHIDDAGRPRQHSLRVCRERADIGLLFGELRLLAFDHLDPAFKRERLGAAAGQARMRVGVGVDKTGYQGRAMSLNHALADMRVALSASNRRDDVVLDREPSVKRRLVVRD